MQFKDYYQVLGVAKTATPEEIKKAYRKLARKHHPDVSKESDATQRMAELNEANDVLSDAEKRSAYDTLGDAPQARDGQDFRPPPNWGEGVDFGDVGGGGSAHSDFFEQLFGRAGRAGHPQRGPVRGEDQHAEIELDILDAFNGAERTLSLRTARHDEHGRVVHETRQLDVKIPKGVHAGQHIRLAGRGGAGSGGAAAGDLLLEVRFRPDARWRAEGRDIYQPVLLAPWEAALGASAQVQTPGGAAQVTVPAGWKAGRKLRLKGRGIPGRTPGDLYLELGIALPAADSDAGREAYAALARAFPAFAPRSEPTT